LEVTELALSKDKSSNSRLYNFMDFTYENYRYLIQLAKKNYIFRNYLNFTKNEKYILWRHDVDFSIQAAVNLARIEMNENIKSTYFLLLHSPFYNLFEENTTYCVKEIVKMGHDIGLHFDHAYYKVNTLETLNYHLLREKNIVQEMFNKGISCFSFHMPSNFDLTFREWEYAGMINTYSHYFQSDVGYCSDSNGYWRNRRLENVLIEAKDQRLQVLTHPMWWQNTVMSQVERLDSCIRENAEYGRQWYQSVAKKTNRVFVDW
jgi:hypothetical protein